MLRRKKYKKYSRTILKNSSTYFWEYNKTSTKLEEKRPKDMAYRNPGGERPKKERGKGNTRTVSRASDLRIVSPQTDIQGCQNQDFYCCYASRPPKLVWSRFFFALI